MIKISLYEIYLPKKQRVVLSVAYIPSQKRFTVSLRIVDFNFDELKLGLPYRRERKVSDEKQWVK